MESASIAKLKVAKFECLRSTLFFTRYFFKHQNKKKFEIGEHHRLIAEALDKVITGDIKKLIINIAPRYGKTELAVKNFIAKGLAHNPAAKFIHLSYSDDLALDNSQAVKDIVKSEEYQQLFPVRIKPNSDSKKKWTTEEGGGIWATSAAGQVTGFGAGQVDESVVEGIDEFGNEYMEILEPSRWSDDEDDEFEVFLKNFENSQKFGGALIIDDPIKPDDADSDTIRDRVNNKFDSTIRNRVNSRNTPIVIIMQRLHEKDLCGHLMEIEPGEWTVLSLPCIKEDKTALWPFKHTVEELQKLRKLNDIVFDRQYMQDPKPLGGILFPEKELNYFKPDPARKFESSLAYADIADEGEDSTAMPIGRNVKDKIYITDVVFSQLTSEHTIPMASAKLTKQECSYVRVESNSMGAMYGRNLAKELKVCQVVPAVSTGNKHTRILMDAGFIKKYCVFLHQDHQDDEYKAFMKQLCGYLKSGKSKHDDAADAMSGLVIFIRAMLPHVYAASGN